MVGSRLVKDAPEFATEGVVFRKLDATMGHDGLPQSATGQTAILTGVNAAEVMNGHYGPWPGPTLKRVLDQGSLFELAQRAGSATLANAFPPGYFAAMSGRRYRPNANVYAATSAGVELRGQAEYRAGAGVPSDLAGAAFASLGDGARSLGAAGSAAVMVELARAHTFTMLDVWLTDHFGHRRDLEAGRSLLERFDAFLAALLDEESGVVAAGGTVVVTSDHGNLEDLTSSSHTRNPVPLIALGPGAAAFAAATSLLDIAPAAATLLGAGEGRLP